jgi:hypothetical protein
MRRREFLAGLAGTTTALTFGGGFLGRLLAGAASTAVDLQPVALEGGGTLFVPAGFSARVVAKALHVPGPSSPLDAALHTGTDAWHPFPDGGAVFDRPDGGWSLVSNCEMPLPPSTGVIGTTVADVVGYHGGGGGLPMTGGVSALDFDAAGRVLGARRLLDRTYVNCAGGATPWGTWLSCEEWDAGLVWEVDPTGSRPARPLPAMGSFSHEAAAVDPDASGGAAAVYLTEDEHDGLLYRFVPTDPHDLAAGGALFALAVDGGGAVSWLPVEPREGVMLDYQDDWLGRVFTDPAQRYPLGTPVRYTVPGATAFDGGEGCWCAGGHVYFTTKGDNRVWDLDLASSTLSVLTEPATPGNDDLQGVDNVLAHRGGTLLVAQDDWELKVQAVDPATGAVTTVVRMEGEGHTRLPTGGVLPGGLDSFERSEVTGLAFRYGRLAGEGDRLYCNSQRYDGFGISYEISGDWGGLLDSLTAP